MRRIRSFSLLVSVVFAVGFCGCGKATKQAHLWSRNPADPAAKYVVLKVNANPLTWGELDQRAMWYLKGDVDAKRLAFPSNQMEKAKEVYRRRAISAFVFKAVMLDDAQRQNIQLTETERQDGLKELVNTLQARSWTTNDYFRQGPVNESAMRREFEEGLIVDKLIRVKVRDAIKVENKEVMNTIVVIGETNDFRRAQLETVRKQVLAGANFEEVARRMSECPSAKNGGDLGNLVRGKVEKPFEEAAFAQKVGVIGPIVETRVGYHILKVTAHTHAQAASVSGPAIPETVRVSHILIKRIPVDRKQIVEAIRSVKYNNSLRNYFDEAKARAKIENFPCKGMSL